jgi:hypothetical protein
MKKLIITTFATFFPFFASALPLSNIADPQLYCGPGATSLELCPPFSLRMGYYGDFVFERNITRSRNGQDSGDLYGYSSYTNAAEFVLNICRYLEFFGTVGQSDVTIQRQGNDEDSNITLFESVLQPAVSWSTGVRFAQEWCHFIWGLEGQYFQYDGIYQTTTLLSDGRVEWSNVNEQFNYREWQGGAGLAYQIESCEYMDLIPYIGITVSGLRAYGDRLIDNQEDEPFKDTYRATKMVGYSVGATALLNQTIGLTVEGRFANETALYVSGQFRF